MFHTDACKEYSGSVATAIVIYETLYPGVCRKCYGAGGHTTPSTWWEPEDYQLCSCIEENDRCPRCGGILGVDWDNYSGDPIVCRHCGWSEEGPDIMPFVDECNCQDAYMDQLLEDQFEYFESGLSEDY
jgi:hypothetical protein